MKIKQFFIKIKRKIKYNKCFSDMEWEGRAASGICCGIYIYNNSAIDKNCLQCPYYIENYRTKNNL